MDEIDRTIIHLLLHNGRLSQEQIAREVHLSRPAVHERMKRLEETGMLRGYQAVIDWEAFGLPLTSFILVRGTGTAQEIGQAIMQLRTENALVQECHSVTGEWCVLLKARVASPRALEQLISYIRTIPGIQNTLTTLALSTFYEDGHAQKDIVSQNGHLIHSNK